jgi:hypothetical protein
MAKRKTQVVQVSLQITADEIRKRFGLPKHAVLTVRATDDKVFTPIGIGSDGRSYIELKDDVDVEVVWEETRRDSVKAQRAAMRKLTVEQAIALRVHKA